MFCSSSYNRDDTETKRGGEEEEKETYWNIALNTLRKPVS